TSTKITERTEAVIELSSGGHGLIPAPPKKARKPSSVSGAKSAGGLEAASVSECRGVSVIHRLGDTKMRAMIHADIPTATRLRDREGFRRAGTATCGITCVVISEPRLNDQRHGRVTGVLAG